MVDALALVQDWLRDAPGPLPAMRDALDAIAGGRAPDQIAAGIATRRFTAFSVPVAAGASGSGWP